MQDPKDVVTLDAHPPDDSSPRPDTSWISEGWTLLRWNPIDPEIQPGKAVFLRSLPTAAPLPSPDVPLRDPL
jgi:hypothetical protein